MIGNPALDIKKTIKNANPWKKQEKYGEIHEGKKINKFHETGNEFEESPTRKGRPLGDGHQNPDHYCDVAVRPQHDLSRLYPHYLIA